MPNTNPPIHTRDVVEYIISKAKETPVDVHPIGCVTKDRKGESIAEMADMKKGGAVAFSDDVFNKFNEENITYLKADWTNRNSEIAEEIEKYNRSGIPLYIYWDKTLDEPMVLNEILTENYLLEVVDEN